MHVIGTAGHVDHGKSTLVTALTGINPDRLKEEREREMTIDLGFAWVTLPDGSEVGIIDVPGHRDFIENMLAGVTGIDAVIFVIAADEGIMPQTREHLAILDLLGVESGIIAMTKVDLVDDPAWLEMVEDEIHEAIQGTVLARAPLIRVSSYTKIGIEELRYQLGALLARKPARHNLGRPRLPVDRVFTIPGFGTVVTGTLLDGELHTGDEITVMPAQIGGRIRGLQMHKQMEDKAVPGSRTAVNLSGVRKNEIKRGDVIVLPGSGYRPTGLVDAHFRMIHDSSGVIRHNQEAGLFIGTSEVAARIRLLGKEELKPGEEGWLQLELADPIITEKGDHYILRRQSPGETLGGGTIIDPHPARRHKRFDNETLIGLERLNSSSPNEIFLQTMIQSGPAPLAEIVQKSHLNREVAIQVIHDLLAGQQILLLESGEPDVDSIMPVVDQQTWTTLSKQVNDEVTAYHQLYPLRRGMPGDQLKNKLPVKPEIFHLLTDKCLRDRVLSESEGLFFLPGREVFLAPRQKALVDRLLDRFSAAPFSPPGVKDCQAELGEELYRAVVESGRLVPVSNEIVFRREDYERLRADVVEGLKSDGTLTVANFRDRYQTSRRYALAFLEHLDAIGVTKRQGDIRIMA